ncbi:unnamed protein product, partial [Polarella glacialis]
AALLIAQKYRWLDSGTGTRRPDAPEIVVLEGRSEEAHCTRTDIRIALSSSTQSMLNQRTKSRRFASGMPVAEIEECLMRRWKKVAPGEAKIQYGRPITDPAELAAEGFDCVLWAAGRRSLGECLGFAVVYCCCCWFCCCLFIVVVLFCCWCFLMLLLLVSLLFIQAASQQTAALQCNLKAKS